MHINLNAMQPPTPVQMQQWGTRWETKIDPQSGKTYWVDHVNKSSTWTNPFTVVGGVAQSHPLDSKALLKAEIDHADAQGNNYTKYIERLKLAKDVYEQTLGPMLSITEYIDIVLRQVKKRRNSYDFSQRFKAIATLQNNGIAVILPKITHGWDDGEDSNEEGVVISDLTSITSGFQPQLTAVSGKDWITMSAPLLQGKNITHRQIVDIIESFNVEVKYNDLNRCLHACICIFSIPCLFAPLCYWRNNQYITMHEKLAARVSFVNQNTLNPHGLQLNYHVQPCQGIQSHMCALHYLTLTSTTPNFPSVCFDAIPGNAVGCVCCASIPDQIPAKTFGEQNKL